MLKKESSGILLPQNNHGLTHQSEITQMQSHNLHQANPSNQHYAVPVGSGMGQLQRSKQISSTSLGAGTSNSLVRHDSMSLTFGLGGSANSCSIPAELIAFEIGIVYLNHRIRVRVLKDETIQELIKRLVLILGVDKEFVLGLYPVENVKNFDNDDDFAESAANFKPDDQQDEKENSNDEDSKAMSEMTLVKQPNMQKNFGSTQSLTGTKGPSLLHSNGGGKLKLNNQTAAQSAMIQASGIKRLVSVGDINFANELELEDQEELEEDSDEPSPRDKKATGKQPSAKRVMADNSDNGTYDEEDDGDDEEQEEGQIQLPEGLISQSVSQLESDKTYLVVYVRQKTEEEIAAEKQTHELELQDYQIDEDGVHLTPRRSQIRKYQIQGINLKESYYKPKREKAELAKLANKLLCPFVNCLRKFTETGNLKTHLRTHTGDRPFVCNYTGCGKQFITKGHLKTHELIHSGDKPFECKVCQKQYSRKNRLNIHMRTHTGEKPFECPYSGCTKTFTERGNLKTHMRIHSGEKPFMCPVDGCEKTFTTQGHLTDHMRRHSGERPFACQYCDAAFMRSSTLKIHIRRHTGEKPYECPHCQKRFSESGNMRTHLKTHETGRNSKKKKVEPIPAAMISQVQNQNKSLVQTPKLVKEQSGQILAKSQTNDQPINATNPPLKQQDSFGSLKISLGKRVKQEESSPPKQVTQNEQNVQNGAETQEREEHQNILLPIKPEPKTLQELKEIVNQRRRLIKDLNKEKQLAIRQMETKMYQGDQATQNTEEEDKLDPEAGQNLGSLQYAVDTPMFQEGGKAIGFSQAIQLQQQQLLSQQQQLPIALNFSQNITQMPNVGSPRSYAAYQAAQAQAVQAMAAGGYQQFPHQLYHHPQLGPHYGLTKPTIPSKQPSFQNLFATLQTQQTNPNFMTHQLQGPQPQQNLHQSPTLNKGTAAPQYFQYGQMQGMPNQTIDQFSNSNMALIQSASAQKNPQGGFGGSLGQGPNINTQTNTKQQNPAQALQNWKNIGSFSSMTSLSDIIMNQKNFQNQYYNQQYYTPGNNSRPMSKQNSSNNLFAPLSIQNMNKFNQERAQFPKLEIFNNPNQGAPLGLQQPQLDAGVTENETLRYLHKTHSLQNLFGSKKPLINQVKDTSSVISGSSTMTFHRPQDQLQPTSTQQSSLPTPNPLLQRQGSIGFIIASNPSTYQQQKQNQQLGMASGMGDVQGLIQPQEGQQVPGVQQQIIDEDNFSGVVAKLKRHQDQVSGTQAPTLPNFGGSAL